MRWLTASTCFRRCISAAQSATCPSPRSPAGCVTCWPGQGVPLPPAVRAASDPYALLRFTLADCPRLAARAEAEICQHEVLAAAAARPSPGIRTLLHGPGSISIIGDVCPAAITGYLARLYPRQMGRGSG